jgi:hypothetical protein
MKIFIPIFLLFSVFMQSANGEVFKKGWGWRPFDKYFGLTLSLNPDKSYVSTYFRFADEKPVDLSTTKESDLYLNLFLKSLLPSYILCELTYYPLTELGGYLYKNKKSVYDNFGFNSPSLGGRGHIYLNIIAAMASRFEAPYMVGLFLGDIVPFFLNSTKKNESSSKEDEKSTLEKQNFSQSGSALMGFAISFGHRRMKLMQILEDNWFHLAWKVRGRRIRKTNKLTWRYEIGYFHHQNKEFIKAFSFSFLRDKATFSKKGFSLLHNSKIEYTFHVPLERISKAHSAKNEDGSESYTDSLDISRYTTFQKVVVGVNFPLRNKLIFTTEMGFKWEAIKDLKKERPKSEFSAIFVPGLKW